MEALEFKPSPVEGSPRKSVLLKFPDFSLSIIRTDSGIFAEILGEERKTFRAEKVDVDVSGSVDRIMEKFFQIVEIHQNE